MCVSSKKCSSSTIFLEQMFRKVYCCNNFAEIFLRCILINYKFNNKWQQQNNQNKLQIKILLLDFEIIMDQTMEFLMTKTKGISKEIQANPWDVIPIKNSKQAKNTTEVHLGNRQATSLTNFQHFPNLQILWLNQNCLTTINGLEKTFRIKHLFLQNNKLKSLQNIFYNLKYIQTLVLYDNQLRDLQKVLQSLKPLSNLKHLDLYQNPVAQQPNYKQRVLFALPALQILDRHKISHQQREEAIKFMAGSKGKRTTTKPFSW